MSTLSTALVSQLAHVQALLDQSVRHTTQAIDACEARLAACAEARRQLAADMSAAAIHRNNRLRMSESFQ